MQSSEFLEYFDKVPNFKAYFKGVFPIDQFPKKLKYRHCFIGNTDVSTGPGLHWVGFIKTKPNTLEIFDSLGVNNKRKRLYLKYLRNFKQVTFLDINKTKFQADSSTSCGKFVIYYIFKRLFNLDLSYKQFLAVSFNQSEIKNETLVNRYCEKLLSN